MGAELVLWIYIVLLVVGGLIGYFKAGSKISLISAGISAVLLGLCAARVIPLPYAADILLGILLLMFAWRLIKTKKFMPSGMMLVLTIAALGAHLALEKAKPGASKQIQSAQ